MSLLQASNRRKFRRSPGPTRVAVFVRLRDEIHAKNSSLLGVLEDKWYKREFEAETPQFFYRFVVGADCDDSALGDYLRSVIIISDSARTWLELYEKAKLKEPRRIGGALALGGEAFDEETRKTLMEKTGGHLPMLLPEPEETIGGLWGMIAETLLKAESLLIWQRVSMATRKKQDKKDLRSQLATEGSSTKQTVWLRLGGKQMFSVKRMHSKYEEFRHLKFFKGEQLPPRKDLLNRDAVFLISNCPTKLVEMYNSAKEEWNAKEIDLSLMQCKLSKSEKKELESRLGGHRPFFCGDCFGPYDGISDCLIYLSYQKYVRMTKAFNLAKIERKRAENRSQGAKDEDDSDADSLISFDSVDELPSDYEDRASNGSVDDSEDGEGIENHDCVKCDCAIEEVPFRVSEFEKMLYRHYGYDSDHGDDVDDKISEAVADSTVKEAFSGLFGPANLDISVMKSRIASEENWLLKIFNLKQKTVTKEYVANKWRLSAEHIQKESSEFTETVLRQVKQLDDDEKVKTIMDSLLNYVSNVQSLTAECEPNVEAKKGVKRKHSESPVEVSENEDASDGMSSDSDDSVLFQPRALPFLRGGNIYEGFESDSNKIVCSSDNERYTDGESSDEPEDSDDEADARIDSVSEDEVNKMLKETYIAFTGKTDNVSAENMEPVIIWKHNWLHRIFHCKQEALLAEYTKENNQPPTAEVKKEIKKRASWHTEILLRKFRRNEDDATIRGHMKGLHLEILKVEAGLTEPWFPEHFVPNNVSGNSRRFHTGARCQQQSSKWSRRRYF